MLNGRTVQLTHSGRLLQCLSPMQPLPHVFTSLAAKWDRVVVPPCCLGGLAIRGELSQPCTSAAMPNSITGNTFIHYLSVCMVPEFALPAEFKVFLLTVTFAKFL